MTYILNYDKQEIEEAKSIVLSLDEDAEKTLSKNNMRQELVIMEKMLQNPEAFSAVIENGTVTFKQNEEEITQKLNYINQEFVSEVTKFAETFTLGSVRLSETPSKKPSENSSIFLFFIPIFSGLLQLAFTIYTQQMQKKQNQNMPNMGAMNAMLYMMPLFSVWLAFTVPAGVGFYWVCSSAFSFLQSIFLYSWFNDERIEKIGAIEREKAKTAKRRPSMMQKLMEQQEEMMKQQGQTAGNKVRYADGEAKISRSEMEEYNTAIIREARRRISEKYGDNEETESNTENSKKKK